MAAERSAGPSRDRHGPKVSWSSGATLRSIRDGHVSWPRTRRKAAMDVSARLAGGALAVSFLAVWSLAVGTESALASAKSLSDAKKAGFPATNCQYCHTEAVPKKDTFKPEALNERGKFLLADQQKRNLKAPDPAALKDFPGGADKK